MDEQYSELMPKVTTVFRGTVKQPGTFRQQHEKKRVAAYCRVSTQMESQAYSLESQMTVFRQKIMEHPGWELVDVYADDGISGTSVAKRKAFMRMMEACEQRQVDTIITKSISRFARNTLECIQYVPAPENTGDQCYF